MPGHSRSKNGVASLAYSRSKNGVASLAYSRSKNGVASLACVPEPHIFAGDNGRLCLPSWVKLAMA